MRAGKRRIYIVGDDESVGQGLKIFLSLYGFQVELFHSAEFFFSAVSNNAPGCLVMDLHMTGMDGWEAMKRLLDAVCTRPVIIISADLNWWWLKDRVLKAGAKGFLQKPFNNQALVVMINRVFPN